MQWIMQLAFVLLIRWIVIYPVDSPIQLLNNRGLENNWVQLWNVICTKYYESWDSDQPHTVKTKTWLKCKRKTQEQTPAHLTILPLSYIGVRAGGARGPAAPPPPPKFGQLRFFGQQEKFWAEPVFEDFSFFFLLLLFWRDKYFLF